MNDIGTVAVETSRPIFFDAYRENRATGSFIVIDPSSNNTVAARMIVAPARQTNRSRGRNGCQGRIQKDLLGKFESVPLEHFDKFTLQVHLNDLPKTRSRDRVLQIRAYVRDIFAEAVDQDFLSKDPARKVEVPRQQADTDTTVLNWDQLRSVLAELSLKDRLILELDMTDALRPSELFGLRWRDFNYDECQLVLRETVYRGKLRNGEKLAKRCARCTSQRNWRDDLWLWQQESKRSEPDDFIFPNRLRKGGFIDPHNYRRKMRKLGDELGLPKLTFQVIRRTMPPATMEWSVSPP